MELYDFKVSLFYRASFRTVSVVIPDRQRNCHKNKQIKAKREREDKEVYEKSLMSYGKWEEKILLTFLENSILLRWVLGKIVLKKSDIWKYRIIYFV